MKTKMIYLMVILSSSFILHAQVKNLGNTPSIFMLTKDQKELVEGKPSRESVKQLKNFKRQGYMEIPGYPSLAKQLDMTKAIQISTDDKGLPRFVVRSYHAAAEDYIAASKFAEAAMKTSILGMLESLIEDRIKTGIGVENPSKTELESVSNMASASKLIAYKKLTNIIIPFSAYKELNNGYEVWIQGAYDKYEIQRVAQEQAELILKERNEKLMKENDNLLNSDEEYKNFH